MTMMLRLSLLLTFLYFTVAVTSNQDIPKSLWRNPLRILRTIFSQDAVLQAAIDGSKSSDAGDEILNVSALRKGSDGEKEKTGQQLQYDDDFQADAVNTPVGIHSLELAKSHRDHSNDRSIVYNSVVDNAAKSMEAARSRRKGHHSRPSKSSNDKFCTEDCSSRSHLPSNPGGHVLGSNDRW